ncbi:MAG: hypothetical protein FWF11_01145, partial [Coriobacteriia bacterium]|nr:hypothetical protein [Coriobacteriia bacterium]
MKKLLILTTLVMVLVLSVTAIAGARYDGFYAGGPNSADAYLAWADAQASWQRNGAEGVQNTAHGDYRTTTAKCFVCHSAHRAYAPAASTSLADAVNMNRGLTDWGAGNACITCHATAGSTGATKLVEWGTMYGNAINNGPHESFGCTGQCHAAGIHGWSTSEFHGMNVYLLGGDSDAEIRADFAAGNANSVMRRTNLTGTPGRPNVATGAGTYQSSNILYYPGGLFPAGQTTEAIAADGTTGYTAPAARGGGPTFGPAWFQFGPDTPPSCGRPPASMAKGAYQSETVFAAAKATATGYTCGRSGCHTSGTFAVNTWGFS